jgi:hypothetical protein
LLTLFFKTRFRNTPFPCVALPSRTSQRKYLTVLALPRIRLKINHMKFTSRLLSLSAMFLFVAAVCAAQTDDPNSSSDLPSSPVATQNENAPYEPITGHERLQWFLDQTVEPQHVVAGIFVAGLATARDVPWEYQGTWAGFGKRLAVREAGITLSNGMEAGLGELWGEDPRYFRNSELPFARRLDNVIKQTFLARRSDGNFHLAYARYSAFVGNNFLANAWLPSSIADSQHALERTGWAFLGRMGSNAWDEFWPDLKVHVFHHQN